jgi:hypothetical protein
MLALFEPDRLHVVPGRLGDAELVYDLRSEGGDSGDYYAAVARLCDEMLARIEWQAGAALDGYGNHVQEFLRELPRSRGEYAIEMLMLGLALRSYGAASASTPRWAVVLIRELSWLRRGSAWKRRIADLARVVLIRLTLAPRIGRRTGSERYRLDGLPRLIGWLQATGEFEQETMRLNNWRSFLYTLPPAEAEHWMETAVELFDGFAREAERTLGSYTRGVASFLAHEYPRRGWREDQIFCGKEPAVYHLNMVAAEAMNRGLREAFERAPQRAVLVPTCMRGASESTCQAQGLGLDITCGGCDPACAVNRVTRRMRALGARVYLVPHVQGFGQWLGRRPRTPEFGVVIVACLLNILPGGYEMRSRGIAAQCVPLDSPGCQKHWSRNGIATSLNEERLVQIVSSCPRGCLQASTGQLPRKLPETAPDCIDI